MAVKARLIEGPVGGRFPFSNCLLIEESGTRVLVDAGCGRENLEHLRDRVDAVLFTHHHPDHISGYWIIGEGKPVFSPAGEEPYRSLEDLGKRFAGHKYRDWIEMARALMDLRLVPAGEYYEPGEDFCFRGLCVKTVPAPGHLLTHTLLDLGGGWIHLTDIDLTGFGPWYANPESSPQGFLDDILMVPSLDPVQATTSHKPDLFTGQDLMARLARYAMRIPDVMEAIYSVLLELGQSDAQGLAGRGIVYRRYIGGVEEAMRYFETMMISKLLPWMADIGCVARSGTVYKPAGNCDTGRLRSRILDALGVEGVA